MLFVVIPTIRSALRTRFARSKNTAQSRGAIRSQVVLELEEMKSREIVDSYGEVLRLRAFGGLSFQAIGAAYGKSETWARVTCFRARQRLKEEME